MLVYIVVILIHYVSVLCIIYINEQKKKSKYKINVQYTYMNKKIIKKKKKKQNIVNYAILVK
jgi:hypothetical protein